MSESGDYDPGPWRGHDFAAARAHYDAHAGRSYRDTSSSRASSSRSHKKITTNLLEPKIETNSCSPLLIFCDITGSMGDWPATMFSKLPYLELEGQEYLGKDLQIAFGAIGDFYANQHPLQVRPFACGTDLKDRMLELDIEGGGGGTLQESYELAALYALHNVSIPKAIRPIMIMIGDEMPYDDISCDVAEKIGISLQKRVSTTKVFEELQQKFSVYMIRKPYGRGSSDNALSEQDREIRAKWVKLLGADHVCDLPEAGRVVDVIFGILAKETDRIEYFREEIEGRQREDQVDVVYKSLATIHTGSKKKGPKTRRGQSILKIENRGPVSRRLLGKKEDDDE